MMDEEIVDMAKSESLVFNNSMWFTWKPVGGKSL